MDALVQEREPFNLEHFDFQNSTSEVAEFDVKSGNVRLDSTFYVSSYRGKIDGYTVNELDILALGGALAMMTSRIIVTKGMHMSLLGKARQNEC